MLRRSAVQQGLLIAVVVIVALTANAQYQELVEEQRSAASAIVAATTIRAEILSAEVSLRSYVVSEDVSALPTFDRAPGEISRAVDGIRGQLDQAEFDRMSAVADGFERWRLAFAAPAIVDALAGREDDARHKLIDGQQVLFDLRSEITQIERVVSTDLVTVGERLDTAAPIASGSMIVAGLGAIGVAITLARRVNRHVAQPMVELATDTRRLGAGDLTARSSASGVREVDDIAGAFNATAARLEETVAGLRELDELKSEFVSMVSHELRTPLTSILGYVDALLDEEPGPLNEEQREYADAVDRNAKRLQALVEDLLTLSRLDAGRLNLELVPVDVGPVVASVCRDLGERATAKDVSLTADAPDGLVVDGDADRLAQIVTNLVSNAVKFTPSGRSVHVDVRRDDDDIVVEVRDEGIGIPADELPHLFERFFRAHGAGSFEGTGLGLAITGELVDLHSGTITVASVDGEGSTFTVRLPGLS